MPGGVNSPVRAFRAVGGTPVVFERAAGPRLIDVDGNEYIDFVCSWGAILLGHGNESIAQAVSRTAVNGSSFGAPNPRENTLARLMIERVPGLEIVRLTNSGTEAAQSVIRLARAATGRTAVVKFAGNYHGAIDPLLVSAGSGVATLSLPDSPGVPAEVVGLTRVARFNDLASVDTVLDNSVAAVLVEPVAGNMGLVPPDAGFLEELRARCDAVGALLVFDEVMTGFRVGFGGAAKRYAVTPDLYVFGKVIGGGLPVGAYGGRADLMRWVAPAGPMYQAGTLAGNPVCVASGIAALLQLNPAHYDELETRGSFLQAGLQRNLGPGFQVQRVGSMISVFRSEGPVRDFRDASAVDREWYAEWFHRALDRGVYLPPSALESWFFSLAHSESVLEEALDRLFG